MSGSTRAPGFGTALVVLTVVAAAVAPLAPSRPALAAQATFAVTKTADTNDGACTAKDCSLREAIIAANGAGGNAVVEVPAGTFRLTLRGGDEDFAAAGDLDLRAGMTVRGAGARTTVIDGNGRDRVFHTPFQGNSTPFTANISSVTITGGVAGSVGGGILHSAGDGTLNLLDSAVRGNRASQGGGITIGGGAPFLEGTMTVRRSTVSGNRAPGGQGGGIQNTGTLTLENTTVSGNKSMHGGGIRQHQGTLRITDSTIAFNMAGNSGGGIFANTGAAAIKNSIVSNNQSPDPFNMNCDGPVVSKGNNLEKGTNCGFDQPGDRNAAPKLGELANNGGSTDTHALLNGSLAIDAGGGPFPATDQRGVTRPQGVANDIGAYEKKPRRR